MKKYVFAFATLALAAASAAEKHTVQFFQPTVIGGQELKPGEYRLTVDGNKLTIKDGKRVIESDIKVETSASKNAATTVRYTMDKQVTEIRLAGGSTKLVLSPAGTSAN